MPGARTARYGRLLHIRLCFISPLSRAPPLSRSSDPHRVAPYTRRSTSDTAWQLCASSRCVLGATDLRHLECLELSHCPVAPCPRPLTLAMHAFPLHQGLSQLASVLRTKGCSSLRKTHLLHLARSWGYASDLWCRRDERRQHMAKVEVQAREAAAKMAPAQQTAGGNSAGSSAAGGQKTSSGTTTGGGGATVAPGGGSAKAVSGVKRPNNSQGTGAAQKQKQKPSSGQRGAARTTVAQPFNPFGVKKPGASIPQLMLPRVGAARSTAGGIAAWAVDVRSGPPDATPLGVPSFASTNEEDASAPLAAIASHIDLVLRPLAADSARRFGGSDMDASASMASRLQLHSLVSCAADWMEDIASDMAAALAGLRSRAASLPTATAATVAWLQLLGRACPLEDCMLRLQQGLHAATMGGGDGAPSSGMAMITSRWPEDMVQGALMALELVARVQSLATQSKFTSYGTYVKVTVQLKSLMADFTAQVAGHLRTRSARLTPPPALAVAQPAASALGLSLHIPEGPGFTGSVFDDLFLPSPKEQRQSPSSEQLSLVTAAVSPKLADETGASIGDLAALWQ